MTPDEVIGELFKYNIKITRRTLLNYEKWGLIPSAERGGGGAGGRWANYPSSTVNEAYATWGLIHGEYGNPTLRGLFDNNVPRATPQVIALVRKKANEVGYSEFNDDLFDEYDWDAGLILKAFYVIWTMMIKYISIRRTADNLKTPSS